jgi:hypothetical protein
LSPKLLEILQVLKYVYKNSRLDFTDNWVAKEEDYTIDGQPTEAAVRELLALNRLEELDDLLKNVDYDTDVPL